MVYSKTSYENLECNEIWGKWVRVFDTESPAVFWMRQEDPELIECVGTLFALAATEERWSQQDVSDQTIWVRPLDSFMGVVTDSFGEGTNCYRFERVTNDTNEP
jgi:hypothetical protein